jgi:hypothetical protein
MTSGAQKALAALERYEVFERMADNGDAEHIEVVKSALFKRSRCKAYSTRL